MKHHGHPPVQDRHPAYDDAINYLYGLQLHGIKLGLTNIRRLLSLAGDPHKYFRTIHIAGTNGKGSTAAMMASILAEAGYRTGLFTSPHLVSFTERIRINSERISKGDVVRLTGRLRELVINEKDLRPTFFEFVTAMALLHFRERGAEWVVLETGMGGRLDATNVVEPEVAVITRVGMDHMEFLGAGLGEIAGEKAGIIKEAVPVVVARQEEEAAAVIMNRAEELSSPLFACGRDFSVRNVTTEIRGTSFDFTSRRRLVDGLFVPLCGAYQAENAALALQAMELLGDAAPDEQAMREGLAATRWEGRCEFLQWRFPMLLDGAHNIDAVRALAATLKEVYLKEFRSIMFIIGCMADKDIRGYLSELLPLGRVAIFTTLGFERAASSEMLGDIAGSMGIPALAAENTEEALRLAATEYTRGDLVVVTGSFYTVGEVKGAIGEDSSLMGLTEFR